MLEADRQPLAEQVQQLQQQNAALQAAFDVTTEARLRAQAGSAAEPSKCQHQATEVLEAAEPVPAMKHAAGSPADVVDEPMPVECSIATGQESAPKPASSARASDPSKACTAVQQASGSSQHQQEAASGEAGGASFRSSFLHTLVSAVRGVGGASVLEALRLLQPGDAIDVPGRKLAAGTPCGQSSYLRVDLRALAAVFFIGTPSGHLEDSLHRLVESGELLCVLYRPTSVKKGRSRKNRPQLQQGAVVLVPITAFEQCDRDLITAWAATAAGPCVDASDFFADHRAPTSVPCPKPTHEGGAAPAGGPLHPDQQHRPAAAASNEHPGEAGAPPSAPTGPERSHLPAFAAEASVQGMADGGAIAGQVPCGDMPPAGAGAAAAAPRGRRTRAHASTLPPSVLALPHAKLQSRSKRGTLADASCAEQAIQNPQDFIGQGLEPINEEAGGHRTVEKVDDSDHGRDAVMLDVSNTSLAAPPAAAAGGPGRSQGKRKLGRGFDKFAGAVEAQPAAGDAPCESTGAEAAAEVPGKRRKAVQFANENAAPAASDDSNIKAVDAATSLFGAAPMTRKRRQSLAPALAAAAIVEPVVSPVKVRRGRPSTVHGI